jgi:hypothetical protein
MALEWRLSHLVPNHPLSSTHAKGDFIGMLIRQNDDLILGLRKKMIFIQEPRQKKDVICEWYERENI